MPPFQSSKCFLFRIKSLSKAVFSFIVMLVESSEISELIASNFYFPVLILVGNANEIYQFYEHFIDKFDTPKIQS